MTVSLPAWDSFREISGITEGVELHYNPIDSGSVRAKAEEKVDLPKDVPLILDDALVNFDDARAKAAIGLLKQEAQTRQVILFTCRSLPQ